MTKRADAPHAPAPNQPLGKDASAMQEEGIRFLIAMAILVVAYGGAATYFLNPEKCFVKRLRPASGGKVTHARLLFRAFIGGGLIVGGLNLLAYIIAFDIPLSVLWSLGALPPVALIAVGGMGYTYFRLVKYRRLSPDDADAGAFVLRDDAD